MSCPDRGAAAQSPPRTVGALVQGLDARIEGDAQTAIDAICYDSRRVTPGALFVALRGQRSDGHAHVEQAVAAGARALLVERSLPAPLRLPVTIATVADTRAALPRIAARFFGEPARGMTLIGVTGTNGKTSTVRLIESILRAAGRAAGSLGTISARYAGQEQSAALTTPESVELQSCLRDMRDAGVDHVAMEVSSHSLEAGRPGTLRFAVAAFTNLTQDHLDFHGDMESYARSKQRLFEREYLDGDAVLPAGDPWTPRLAAAAREGAGADRRVWTYARGAAAGADVYSDAEHVDLSGAQLLLRTPIGDRKIRLPLPGDFQIDNALAAVGCALALDVPLDRIVAGLESCEPVPGRLERVSDRSPAVFVDYAHTPDALERVLARVRPLVEGRLICVFGCGGDRDRGKRAPMARAACRHSDLVIATSDNPRTEDPDAILADVAAGLSESSRIVRDRRDAIASAIREARPDDVVVIAGKGHETYQIVGDQRRSFDDRAEARLALERGGSHR